MSTNSECLFIQVKTDQWFYVLEDYNAPNNAWDWREYATAYGPFKTEDEANEHLCDNHANPGGSMTQELPEGVSVFDLSDDATMRRLIDEAPRNMRGTRLSC